MNPLSPLRMALLTGPTIVHTEISQQLLDGLILSTDFSTIEATSMWTFVVQIEILLQLLD